MANNVEWSHADYRPTVVDPDDVPSGYEGLGVGEVGVWLGSDGANILYGSKDAMIEWAKHLLKIIEEAEPVGHPDDGNLIAIHNLDMHGKGWSPEERVDWDVPDVHTTQVWEQMLNCTVEEYAAASPHMVVMVVTDEEAEEIGYDWQDDAIGAMR